MKKVLITLFFGLCFLNGKAQEDYVTKIQGNWIGYISSDNNSPRVYYEVIINNDKLSIVYERDTIIEVIATKIGFINNREKVLLLSDLKRSGRYLCDCVIKGETNIDCFLIEGFSITGDAYWYGNTDVYDFNKVKSLPQQRIITDLLNLEDGQKLFYLQKFFNLVFKKIRISKSIIYSVPNKRTKTYLALGDFVELVEEDKEWLKIRHYPEKDGKWTGETIEGWIRKEDVE